MTRNTSVEMCALERIDPVFRCAARGDFVPHNSGNRSAGWFGIILPTLTGLANA